MFAGIKNVFLMETMMRFTDPVLRTILEKMRTPGGACLADMAEWQTLKATAVDADTLDDAAARRAFFSGEMHSGLVDAAVPACTCPSQSCSACHLQLYAGASAF